MKNIVKTLCVVLLIFVAGNFSAIAQDSPLLKKETKEKVGTKATDAKKAAGDIKSDKSALGQDNKKETGNAVNSATSKKKDDAKAAIGDVKKTATDAAGQNADEMDEYKEKLSKAKTVEERMALEKKMKKEQAAKSNLKGDTPKDVETIKGGITKGKPLETSNEDKDYTDLKGRELGKAKASDAKLMIEKKEAEITRKDANIDRSRERIEAARKRVRDQLDAGQISTDEANTKQAKIDKAEQRLKDYETRLETGKQKLSDHKTTVNDMYIKD